MTLDEVKAALAKSCMAEAVLIGSEEDRETYFPAIVEINEESAFVVYDYNLLVKCFAEQFREYDGNNGKTDDELYTEAIEWVDYNVMRSLPYLGEHAPFIRESEEDE